MRNLPRVLHLALAAACAVVFAAPPLLAQARTPAPTKDSAQVVYDDDGLRIHSADKKKQLKIRGYAVGEYHAQLTDTSDALTNGFSLKRARLTFDANLNAWIAARVMFDVGPPSSTSPIQDAYVDVGLGGTWWLRAGKQKTPFGLERYMSTAYQLLPDRSIAANLHGSRDMGLLLTGSVFDQHLDLSLGVFDGVPDGNGTQDSDPNDGKDVTYRVWWKPVRTKVKGVEQGFGLAFNGSTGMESSPSATGAKLPVFKTIGTSTFFNYLESGGVRAAGRHSRNGVFSYFHSGAFGTLAEWFGNSQAVMKGASTATIATGGWVANAQYSLTGEPSAQEGLTPTAVFDPEKGNWGAWQLGIRAAQIRVGDEAFPVYADSTVAARGALETGVALNWFITRSSRMQFAYEHTTFKGGSKKGDRKTEQFIQIRWQAYF